MQAKGHAKYHLIESFDEVAIQQLLFPKSFANNLAHEIEQFYEVVLNCRLWIWEVGWPVVCFDKEG